MQFGDTTSPGRAWVMAFQTPWLPIPSSGPLVGGGAVAVHSEEWILTQPGPVDWYWIPSFELVRVLGEDGLGSPAFVVAELARFDTFEELRKRRFLRRARVARDRAFEIGAKERAGPCSKP